MLLIISRIARERLNRIYIISRSIQLYYGNCPVTAIFSKYILRIRKNCSKIVDHAVKMCFLSIFLRVCHSRCAARTFFKLYSKRSAQMKKKQIPRFDVSNGFYAWCDRVLLLQITHHVDIIKIIYTITKFQFKLFNNCRVTSKLREHNIRRTLFFPSAILLYCIMSVVERKKNCYFQENKN